MKVVVIFYICLFLLFGCRQEVPREVVENEQELKEEKVLIVVGDFPPYINQKEEKGFLLEAVKEIMDQMEIPYEIEFYPWERCREMVKRGQAWASFPYAVSENNDDFFLYSEPLFSTRHVYYYKTGHPFFPLSKLENYRSLEDFKGLTFGGINSYWYGTARELEEKGLNVHWAEDVRGLFEMLLSGRIDFLIEDELAGDLLLETYYKEEKNKKDSSEELPGPNPWDK